LASKLLISLGDRNARTDSVRVRQTLFINADRQERRYMNAFELLKKDHQKVSDIFEELEPTTERALKTREELFAKLKHELDVHAKIEEEIFYPAIKDAKATHDITLEDIEEHNVVKQLLAELEEMPKGDERWSAKLTVLKENVEHHVEEEEGEMFKDAKKVLSSQQIEELGARMEAVKQAQAKTFSATSEK
jgi:iron-sulfur cluster repair protein YtfE (RIC family)